MPMASQSPWCGCAFRSDKLEEDDSAQACLVLLRESRVEISAEVCPRMMGPGNEREPDRDAWYGWLKDFGKMTCRQAASIRAIPALSEDYQPN